MDLLLICGRKTFKLFEEIFDLWGLKELRIEKENIATILCHLIPVPMVISESLHVPVN